MEGKNLNSIKNVKEYQDKKYQNVLYILKRYGFEMTMAESSTLRETIKKITEEINEEKIKTNETNIEKEILTRFFWYYYEINLEEYLRMTKITHREDAIKDLFKHIQEKIRKDTELI